jgi:hypothetical protein
MTSLYNEGPRKSSLVWESLKGSRIGVEKVFARKYPFVVKVRIYERLSEISHISIRANIVTYAVTKSREDLDG